MAAKAPETETLQCKACGAEFELRLPKPLGTWAPACDECLASHPSLGRVERPEPAKLQIREFDSPREVIVDRENLRLWNKIRHEHEK